MPATKTAATTFPTHIDLPEGDRERLIELLNGCLADTGDLYSQIKQAHWNVKGRPSSSFICCLINWPARGVPLYRPHRREDDRIGRSGDGNRADGGGQLASAEYPIEATEDKCT